MRFALVTILLGACATTQAGAPARSALEARSATYPVHVGEALTAARDVFTDRFDVQQVDDRHVQTSAFCHQDEEHPCKGATLADESTPDGIKSNSTPAANVRF